MNDDSDAKRAARLACSFTSDRDEEQDHVAPVCTKNPPGQLSILTTTSICSSLGAAASVVEQRNSNHDEQKSAARDTGNGTKNPPGRHSSAASAIRSISETENPSSQELTSGEFAWLETVAHEQEKERASADRSSSVKDKDSDAKSSVNKEAYAVAIASTADTDKDVAENSRLISPLIPSSNLQQQQEQDEQQKRTSMDESIQTERSSAGAFRVAGIGASASSESDVNPQSTEECQDQNPDQDDCEQPQESAQQHEQEEEERQSQAREILIEATLVNSLVRANPALEGDDGSDIGDSSVYSVAEAVNLEEEGKKRNCRLAEIIVIVVIAAVGITVGGFCGSGACRSSSSSNADVTSDNPVPTLEPQKPSYLNTSMPSSAPSEAPTWAPFAMPELVVDNLPEYTLEALRDPSSPQSIAHDWVANDPSLATYTNKRRVQRFALATLYAATSGDRWRNNNGWMSYEESECTWYQKMDIEWYPQYNSSLPCYENTTTYRYLTPWDNRLMGQIPKEIALLTNLINLDISNGIFDGTVPSQLSALTQLRMIYLNDHRYLQGTIPSEFGRLTNLDTLFLSDTKLSGTLPTQLGLLTSLTNMRLEFTFLSGTVPEEICALANASIYVTDSAVECPEGCAKSCE